MWMEWGLGLVCVAVTSALLVMLVFRDLAPSGGLIGRGRWLLALGLGGGLLAFGGKLLLIGVFLISGESIVATLAADRLIRPEQTVATATSIEAKSDPAATWPQRYQWQALPEQAPVPPSNPMNADKIALGRQLFVDKDLSFDRQLACVSCHDLRTGGDGRRTSVGIRGQRGRRNAPSVWNAAFQARLFWDGRAGSLEEQAQGPFINPIEMGMPSLDAVVTRVLEKPAYRSAFAKAFGSNARVTGQRVVQALAAYERTLITPDTPYDRFVRGETDAMSPQAVRGMALFDAIGCVQCHHGPNFSGASLLTAQVPYRIFPATGALPDERWVLLNDLGLGKPADGVGVWRIPSLRNVALTAPYFHNGAVDRLEDAVRIMAQSQLGWTLAGHVSHGEAGEEGPKQTSAQVVWAPDSRTAMLIPSRVLGERDVADIVAFLQALSSDQLVAASRRPSGWLP